MWVKFWQRIVRFWFFLSYLITTVSEEMQEKEKKCFLYVFSSFIPFWTQGLSLHAEGTKICNKNLEHKCLRILAFSDIFFKVYLQLCIFEWTTFVILVKLPGVTFIPGVCLFMDFLYIWTELLSILFWWSAHMRRELGT